MSKDVRVAILGDSRDFNRAVRSVQGDADKMNRSFDGVGRGAARMGKAVAVGTGLAVVAVAMGAKKAIDAGSDLNEVISKSNTVFKDQGAAMMQWASNSATAFGQSKKEALEAASSFGNMFIQLGIGRGKAAKMSQSMTELASDFASFHNADISEVLIAQQAAFRGEYDAVQRFVPTINAAAVEQKALKMGLAKTTKELTAQDKALAVQTLLMEGAGDAMGDFARTSDGMANKQRILKARFDDLTARIGQGLIPIALALAGFLADRVLPVFEEVGGGIAAMVGGFNNAEDGLTSSGIAGMLEGIGIWAHGAYLKIRELVEDALAALSGWWEKNGDDIQNAARDIGSALVTAFTAVATFVRDTLLPVLYDIAAWVIDNKPLLIGIASAIAVVLVGAFVAWAASATAAAVATLAATWPILLAIVAIIAIAAALYYAYQNWGWFRTGVDTAADAIGPIITWLAAAVVWIWNLVNAIDAAINRLGTLARTMKNLSTGGLGIGGGGGSGAAALGFANGDKEKAKTGKAQGGIVPGAFGQPMPILAHGGEFVMTRGQQMRGGGGSGPIYLTVEIMGRQVGAAVLDMIDQAQSSDGAIRIRTRAG